MNDRDLLILQFIAKFGYCLEPIIATYLSLTAKSISRVTSRLIKAGYLQKQKIISSHKPYLFLTKKSASLLSIKLNSKVTLHTLMHDNLLTELYIYLLNNIDSSLRNTILTDKELRREKRSLMRIPDLLINDQVAIELELSYKPLARLQDIINSYILMEEITEVNYYCESGALARRIHSLTLSHPKFKFLIIQKSKDNILEPIILESSNIIKNEEEEPIVTLSSRSSFVATSPQKIGDYVF